MEIINLEIKKLAIQFRNAIERAKRKGDLPKNDFRSPLKISPQKQRNMV